MLQAYQQSSCEGRAAVQQAALRVASQCAEAYSACAIRAPPGWLQQAEALGVRQVLHFVFELVLEDLCSSRAEKSFAVIDVCLMACRRSTRHNWQLSRVCLLS